MHVNTSWELRICQTQMTKHLIENTTIKSICKNVILTYSVFRWDHVFELKMHNEMVLKLNFSLRQARIRIRWENACKWQKKQWPLSTSLTIFQMSYECQLSQSANGSIVSNGFIPDKSVAKLNVHIHWFDLISHRWIISNRMAPT